MLAAVSIIQLRPPWGLGRASPNTSTARCPLAALKPNLVSKVVASWPPAPWKAKITGQGFLPSYAVGRRRMYLRAAAPTMIVWYPCIGAGFPALQAGLGVGVFGEPGGAGGPPSPFEVPPSVVGSGS